MWSFGILVSRLLCVLLVLRSFIVECTDIARVVQPTLTSIGHCAYAIKLISVHGKNECLYITSQQRACHRTTARWCRCMLASTPSQVDTIPAKMRGGCSDLLVVRDNLAHHRLQEACSCAILFLRSHNDFRRAAWLCDLHV